MGAMVTQVSLAAEMPPAAVSQPPLHRTFTKRVPRSPKWAVVSPKAYDCNTADHGKPELARYLRCCRLVRLACRAHSRQIRRAGTWDDAVTARTCSAEVCLLALLHGRADVRDVEEMYLGFSPIGRPDRLLVGGACAAGDLCQKGSYNQAMSAKDGFGKLPREVRTFHFYNEKDVSS